MKDWDLRPARDMGLPAGRRLASARREPGTFELACHRAWGAATSAYFRLWHGFNASGRERLPCVLPFVLVANHTSHLDALALALLVPPRLREWLFPISAGDVFFETPMRTLLAAMFLNALPMWRRNVGRHALDDLRSRLVEDRCGYILFPEGTRSATGEIQPFKPGLGMLVAGTSVPVVPCHIRGAYEALPRTGRFPRPRTISLSIGEPMTFADLPNERAGWLEVAARAEEAVRRLAASGSMG